VPITQNDAGFLFLLVFLQVSETFHPGFSWKRVFYYNFQKKNRKNPAVVFATIVLTKEPNNSLVGGD